MTVEAKVSLTEDEEAYARALVEQGRFPNLSAVLQRGLSKLREELDPIDRHLSGVIRPRVDGPFVVLVQPTSTTYGVERAEAVARDISHIGRYAFSNSMSWVAADDESVHEEAATSRMSEAEAAIMQFTGDQGEPWGWIVPGLRRVVFEKMLIYFIVDDERRTVRLMLLLPW
jgi:antitoxin ParD1/3/4